MSNCHSGPLPNVLHRILFYVSIYYFLCENTVLTVGSNGMYIVKLDSLDSITILYLHVNLLGLSEGKIIIQ